MRKMGLVCAVAGLIVSGMAMGQAPAAPAAPAAPLGPAGEVQRSYSVVKGNI